MTRIFIFTLLCGASERFYLFEAPERSLKIKNLCCFPPYSIGTRRVKTALNLTYAISISLTIEIQESNIETVRVTNKQYYIIILYLKFLSNKIDIFRELMPNTTDFFQENCTRQYLFLSQM